MTPPACIVFTIEDANGGVLQRLTVRNDVGAWPQHLGSGVSDEIRVASALVPPRAVRLTASGPHFLVTALVDGCVVVGGAPLAAGRSRRADGGFQVAGLRVAFAVDDDE